MTDLHEVYATALPQHDGDERRRIREMLMADLGALRPELYRSHGTSGEVLAVAAPAPCPQHFNRQEFDTNCFDCLASVPDGR